MPEYQTSQGTTPENDPRRPALCGFHTGSSAFEIIGAVVRALKDAGYSSAERNAYRTQAMSGNYDDLLGISHQWCRLNGGSYTGPLETRERLVEVPVFEAGDEDGDGSLGTEWVGYDVEIEEVQVEVFVCGSCGHEERSEYGIHDQCGGCGYCHDCCCCQETLDYDDDRERQCST